MTEPGNGGYPPGSVGSLGRTSGLAVASLVLGIVGLVAIPLVASIAAIVLGRNAQRDIARDPRLEGEGFATAGIMLGWIGVGLVLLGVLLIIGLAGCATSSGVEIGSS
jgi:magnesium-transporting ATPase (P-type)